ncbi:MAG TPA: hypothetical protein VL053_04635 [Arachidicoccus sp.]|nr:hypothetical protein [Arachidicoccus sp.]
MNPITPLAEAITGRSVETYGRTELSIKERVDALALFVVAGIGTKRGLKPLGLGSTGRTVAANLR